MPRDQEKQADLEKGLDLAVETLKDGFKQLREDLRSIQNRSGVGLTLSLAALSGGAIRIRERFSALEGDIKTWVLVGSVVGTILLIGAVILFIESLRARILPYGYNYEIILREQWRKGGIEFQKQALSDLGKIIQRTKTIVDEKGRQLNQGVFLSILGVLIVAAIEILLGPVPKS